MELEELIVDVVDSSLAPVCAETPLIWLPISSCLVCLFPRSHCKPKTPLHFPYTRERTECKVGIREI